VQHDEGLSSPQWNKTLWDQEAGALKSTSLVTEGQEASLLLQTRGPKTLRVLRVEI
jgi:hypothetical protein